MDRQISQVAIEDSTAGITAGIVESVRKRSILQTGLRLYDGSTVGVAGCLGEPDMADLEKRALDAMGGVAFPWEPNRGITGRRERAGDIGGNVLEEAEAFFSALSARFPDILVSGKLTFLRETRSLSSGSMDLLFRYNGFSLGLAFKNRSSNAIADGFLHRAGPVWNREELLGELGREFGAFLNPVTPPSSGKLTVVFIETDTVLSQTVSDLHGLRYATGSSLLKNRLGQAVFSPDFTLMQNPDEFQGSAFFDAEGTVTPEGGIPLIENGVFRLPFTDIRTARTYDLPLTGAASASYDGVPSLGVPDLRIRASDRSLAELLNGEPAVLVSVTSGGDFTPSGGFGAPVQLAYLLDGAGNPTGRLPECSISSTVWSMFGEDFVGVSCDPFNRSSDQRALVMRMAVDFPQG